MRTLEELGISPAPWDYQPNNPQGITVACRGNSTICCLPNKEDVRLVAAAPDLYSALLDCFTYMSKNCCYEIVVFVTEKAKAALAKAGGESEAAK